MLLVAGRDVSEILPLRDSVLFMTIYYFTVLLMAWWYHFVIHHRFCEKRT